MAWAGEGSEPSEFGHLLDVLAEASLQWSVGSATRAESGETACTAESADVADSERVAPPPAKDIGYHICFRCVCVCVCVCVCS